MNLYPPGCLCLVHPLCIVWWKPGCPCMAVCLCPSHLISVATPCLECVHASVHEFMSTLHPMSGPPPMDNYMESCECPCVSLHVCPSPLIFVATPCLECVHASVHEFMSTLHPMSGPPPMDSYMETLGAPVCHCMFVSQSPYFCCYTLFRMCTCISTWIFFYLTLLCLVQPIWIVTWKVGCPYVSLHGCPIHPGCGPTPCLECVHASVHEFMSTWLLMSGAPPMHSLMETWVPLYGSVFVSQSPHFCCHTLFRMCTCISTWIYFYLTPQVWSTPYG